MATPEQSRHRRTLTISTIASTVTISVVVIPVLSIVLRPWAVGIISASVAEEVSEQIQREIAPTNRALRTIIENSIAELEDEISQLEFRREHQRELWTSQDAQLLTSKTRRLVTQRAALASLLSVEK